LKDSIHPDQRSTFLFIVGRAIFLTHAVSDTTVKEICAFVTPLISNQTQPDEIANGLYLFSCLVKHAESFVFSLLPQTINPVKYCLRSRNEEAVIGALRFIQSILNSYGSDALEFASQVGEVVIRKLSRHKSKEHVITALFQAAIEITKVARVDGLIATIFGVLTAEFDRYTDLAIQYTGSIAKLLDNCQLFDLFQRILNVLQNTHELHTAQYCLQALGKLIRATSSSVNSNLLSPSAELFQSIFSGSLPVLNGIGISDTSSELSPGFLDALSVFTSALICIKSDISDSLAAAVLSLVQQTSYHSFILEVLVDGIVADSVSSNAVQSLLTILPRLILLAGDSTRQSIVFLLSILTRRDSQLITAITEVLPVLLEWWLNSGALPLLRANLASFFLHLGMVHPSVIPEEVIFQSIDIFPPADREETTFMASNLLTLASQSGWPEEGLTRTALAVSRLLTETKVSLRKMRIPEEIYRGLVALFRSLCQKETIAQQVFASTEGMAAKAETLAAILRSG
jgi:hypothetical protein